MSNEELRNHLEWVTGRAPLPEGVRLAEVLTWLDGYGSRSDLPERLAHYLSRRSYVKALEWLDDPAMPHRV